MSDCKKCRCKPVCKEIENWERYYEEHVKLREKSILFDSEPKCPYYIENEKMKNAKECVFPNPFTTKKEINDWFEKDKNKIFKAEDIKVKPVSIRFDNGSEIKTIPYDNTTVRSRRSEEYPKYIPYEKYENTEDLFKIIMKALFK